MKQLFFLSALLFLTSVSSSVIAQEHPQFKKNKSNPEYLKAEVFSLNGDTIQALVKNFSAEARWYGDRFGNIPFIQKLNGKEKYSATEIVGYRVKLRNGKWNLYLTHDAKFLNLAYQGNSISLYDNLEVSYSSGANGAVMASAIRTYYLRTDSNEEFVKVTKKEFSNGTYFGECQSLQSDIASKKYKLKDMLQVVKRYDSCL